MKILITGFDPFAGEKINPAIEVIKRLPDEIKGAAIIKWKVPTAFGKSGEIVKDAMQKEQPDYVLNIGQAGGRFGITSERVTINQNDASISDNEGNQPIDTPIQSEGESAYFSQLPIKAMVKSMRDAGVPASISNTAGTFVCNHLMYQTLHLTHTEFPAIKGGFIHIPFLPEQVIERPGVASISLNDMVKGLTAAIGAVVTFGGKEDLKRVGGATH